VNLHPVSEADLRPYIEGAVIRNLSQQIRRTVCPQILILAKERAIALAREKAKYRRRPDHIALAHLLRTERRRKPEFRAAVRSHLRKEKKIVLANLSRGRRTFEDAATKIDPSAFLAPYAAMVEDLKNLATPIISAAVEDTGGSIIEDIGELEAAFDIASPSVMNYIRTYMMKFAESFEQSSRDALIGILEGAAEGGWSVPDIRNAIETQFSDWGRYRSEMVARTEIIRASNEGAAEAYLQSGIVEEKVWITAHDDRLCPFCADMDGRIVGVEENFWDEGDVMQVDVGEQSYAVEFDYGDVGVPPLHPNCRCAIGAYFK